MKQAQEVRAGNVIMVGKDPMVVQKAEFSKSGRNASVVKMKLRNLLFLSRRHGILSPPQAVSFAAPQVLRRFLVGGRQLRAGWLASAYAYDGLSARFRNVPPRAWAELVSLRRPLRELNRRALRYTGRAGSHWS